MRSELRDFGGDELELTVDALQGLDDLQGAALEVDIHPSQAEQLGAAHPEIERQHVEGVEPVVPRLLDEAPRLVEADAAVDAVVRRGHRHDPCDVPKNDLFLACILQGVAQHGVDLLQAARSRVAGDEHPWPALLPSTRFGQLPGELVEHLRVNPNVVVAVDVDAAFGVGPLPASGPVPAARPDLRTADLVPPNQRSAMSGN